MAGANYMGGKRNAAKARSKDATGRVQKGYFGRQRMQALMKGLQHDQTSRDANRELSEGPHAIDLAHARRDLPQDTTSYLVPATPQPPSAKNRMNISSESKLDGSGSSASSNHRSSRVLAALDTTEPLSMKAELHRILAVPDFAGLSQRPHIRPTTPRLRPVLKRRYAPTSDALHHSISVKKPRYSSSSMVSDRAFDNVPLATPSPQPTKLLSPFSIPDSSKRVFKGPRTFSPDSAASYPGILRENLYDVTHTQSEDEDCVRTTISHDDSGYAKSDGEVTRAGQHAGGTVSNEERDDISHIHDPIPCPTFELDSSMLCLDTSPLSSSASFESIIDQSQRSSSSLESYLPDFSTIAPQPFNPKARPMTPSAFRKSRMGDDCEMHKNPEPLPSSAAQPPPPTFCMPSPPKNRSIVSFPASSQDIISSAPSSSQLTGTLHRFPSPLLEQYHEDETRGPTKNLLDETNPWDAIGKYMDLRLPVSRRAVDALLSPPRNATSLYVPSSHDRSGVGYVASFPDDSMAVGKEGPTYLPDTAANSYTQDEVYVSPTPTPPQTISVASFLAPAIPSQAAPASDELPDVYFSTAEAAWLKIPDQSTPADIVTSLHPFQTLASDASARNLDDIQPTNFLGPCLFSDSDETEG